MMEAGGGGLTLQDIMGWDLIDGLGVFLMMTLKKICSGRASDRIG